VILRRRRLRRPRITVYSRAGCHLCEQAEADVRRLARSRAEIEVVDIDTDPRLAERYTLRVPVVAIDGHEVAELQVDPAAVRTALRSALRAPQRAAM
jgi:glutaredoxin